MAAMGVDSAEEITLNSPSTTMQNFRKESVVLCRNSQTFVSHMKIVFNVENSMEMGELMKAYTVAKFIIPQEFYIEKDRFDYREELIRLNNIFKDMDIKIYRVYKQKIDWSESEGTDRQYGNIVQGNLPDEAVLLLDNNSVLMSYQWRQLYYGFVDFARYACLQGDFHATAERSHRDWTIQLDLIYSKEFNGDRTHILTVLMTQVLSEISGYYLHKDKIDVKNKNDKDFMYVFQKQERTRLYFLQQFLEQKRRDSLSRSSTNALSREFPASAGQWWGHYYPNTSKYDGNTDEINSQYKRDIHAAELDHLVIMDLLKEDLKNENFAVGNELYTLLIKTMMDETLRKLKEKDKLNGFQNTLEDEIKTFHDELELRRSERGDPEPLVHTQTNVQHNKCPEYSLILRVVRVQLNTFQLETNSEIYNEKFKIVHDLSSKIQAWMRNSTTNTDYQKQCEKLLVKNYDNSIKFKSWIQNASPDFDRRFQNTWVANEYIYNEFMKNKNKPMGDRNIKNIVIYLVSREFRYFLLLQNLFVDPTLEINELRLRRADDTTRIVLNAVHYLVKHYQENLSPQIELFEPNLHNFRKTYILMLIQVAFIDNGEWMRISLGNGRVRQQCGFLMKYYERYGCPKGHIETVLQNQITAAKIIYASEDKLRMFTSSMVQPEEWERDELNQLIQQQHQRDELNQLIQQQHAFLNHQQNNHLLHHENNHHRHDNHRVRGARTEYDVTTPDTTEEAVANHVSTDTPEDEIQKEDVPVEDEQAIQQHTEHVLEQKTEFEKIDQRKKVIDADELLARNIRKKDEDEAANEEQINVDREKEKERKKKANIDLVNLRKKEKYEALRKFRKHLDDFVYPPYRDAVLKVYNIGTEKDNNQWIYNTDKLTYEFLTKALINQVRTNADKRIIKKTIAEQFKNFNDLRKDMYSFIIDDKGKFGTLQQDLIEDFDFYALPWIRYRLMIELQEDVFYSTTGSDNEYKSNSFFALCAGSASSFERAIMKYYSGNEKDLYWHICHIYIGGKDILKTKSEFRHAYLETLGEEDKSIQTEHMNKFHEFFEREDPAGAYRGSRLSQENDYFVDFI